MAFKRVIFKDLETSEERLFQSLVEFADYFGVSRRDASRILTKDFRNTTVREFYTKYDIRALGSCDEYYFDVDSSKVSYFLGLLYADGNLKKQKYLKSSGEGYRYYVRLSLIDKDILEVLKEELHAVQKIQKYVVEGCKNKYSLEIGSKIMFDSLVRRGFSLRKTYCDDNIEFDSKFEGEFWTGYIDGDGSITYDRNYLRIEIFFSGHSKIMRERFEQFLYSNSIQVVKRSILRVDLNASIEVWSYHIQNKNDLIKFLNLTYLKSPFSLSRKFTRIKEYLSL